VKAKEENRPAKQTTKKTTKRSERKNMCVCVCVRARAHRHVSKAFKLIDKELSWTELDDGNFPKRFSL